MVMEKELHLKYVGLYKHNHFPNTYMYPCLPQLMERFSLEEIWPYFRNHDNDNNDTTANTHRFIILMKVASNLFVLLNIIYPIDCNNQADNEYKYYAPPQLVYKEVVVIMLLFSVIAVNDLLEKSSHGRPYSYPFYYHEFIVCIMLTYIITFWSLVVLLQKRQDSQQQGWKRNQSQWLNKRIFL